MLAARMAKKPPKQSPKQPTEPIGSEHPVLIELQQRLDEEVDLSSIAQAFGYSPFHFHRVFSAKVGETPKEHIDRLRLEKGWMMVAVTEESILNVALAVGFQSHETFTRAFKRAYGETPTSLRRRAKALQAQRLERNKSFRGEGCTLSEVHFTKLPAMLLLTERRVGPYSTSFIDPWAERDPHWTQIARWAEANGVRVSRLAIGLFYDIPGITPPETMRSDYAIPIDAEPKSAGPYRVLAFEGGDYAIAEHRGPYTTIDQAYRHVADGIRRTSDAYAFAEGPPMQLFHESRIGGDPNDNRTEVCFPVRRLR